MKASKLLAVSWVIGFLWLGTARAQVQFVTSEFFPADMEFRELQPAGKVDTIADPASLSKLEAARLFIEVGFEKYEKQSYSADDSGSLTIEIVTLKDSRASYSLLTLLRGSEILSGPPGNAFATMATELMFAHGSHWVRLQGRNISQDLLSRVARSVSNRMGSTTPSFPRLISHFPKLGYDASSVRYFLGPGSYHKYSLSVSGAARLMFRSDMELAQAQYALDNQSGVLTLVSFPTSQMAEDYFETVGNLQSGPISAGAKVYAKKAGPLVAVLEGSFDPAGADKVLSTIQFAYSIKWIYDRNNHSGTIWGVPVGILGTVVRSLVFVGLLAGASIIFGIGMAFFRLGMRTYAPNNFLSRSDRNEIVRLKIDEN